MGWNPRWDLFCWDEPDHCCSLPQACRLGTRVALLGVRCVYVVHVVTRYCMRQPGLVRILFYLFLHCCTFQHSPTS